MRKLLIGLLALFRRVSLLMLKLRGRTTADVAEQRVVSGRAWDEFCDTLKAAGAALNYPGAPRDPFNQAEGYRYLTRLVVARRDPGMPNWLETAGHTSGTMCFRWIKAKDHPQPQTRVVGFSELVALRRSPDS